MITRSVNISDDQAAWIDKHSYNFSEWVRKKLDEAMYPNIEGEQDGHTAKD